MARRLDQGPRHHDFPSCIRNIASYTGRASPSPPAAANCLAISSTSIGFQVFSASPPLNRVFLPSTVSNIGFRNSPSATASKSRAAFHSFSGSAGDDGRAIDAVTEGGERFITGPEGRLAVHPPP